MPVDQRIRRVLVIGSGPIVIGQAAEFDYAGTQACRALQEEGLEVILINSNPATIMTDRAMADHIYIEPLNAETVQRIIEKEKPDSLLSTLGGQTGLTLSMQLAKSGFLRNHRVRLLGADPETIDKAEDRQRFKDTMEAMGEPVIPSRVVNSVEAALGFARENGYPVIVRPAFTLGGSGGGIAYDSRQLTDIAGSGLRQSPITQILVERCVAGWKEIEFEVMRDQRGNCITVCSMENLDPVGIHTGDSIVVAPAVTLADKEYQMLRLAAIRITQAMGIEGGCNCQFALNPDSFEYAVIEVNPRVSRSSALASKATGYPIARVATKIALGYTLEEITNEVTGQTKACFEPALDYVAVKLPKWPFDKFAYADRTLGTQMKATGEVMAIGENFEQALMKAVRGAEISQYDLRMETMEGLSDVELEGKIRAQDDQRLFALYEALRRGVRTERLHELTGIDCWFLEKLKHLAELEKAMQGKIDQAFYHKLKQYGFPDRVIPAGSWRHEAAVYQMVDTCGAEFKAVTPYFYGVHGRTDEAGPLIRQQSAGKPVALVLGSGPIRIGQGIEFDYACVHCIWALQQAGYEAVMINNNPETVSTDFNIADRLYFEPLTLEDVLDVAAVEKPVGVVAAFGGQTAIQLARGLEKQGLTILGTPADSIDAAEDRGRFDSLLEQLDIRRPAGRVVRSEEEAVKAANELGYPVLLRPSYVLGGQNMIIADSEKDVREYMGIILERDSGNEVLIDQYLMGSELEVDAICDGEDVLIPGIMEHIERAGVHSGDSMAVYPAWNVSAKQRERLIRDSKLLALALHTKGLINIQFVIHQDVVYVIEVNPRASRTVPYISKATGIPMVELAVQMMIGRRLADMEFGTGLYPSRKLYAVKVPVFSFEKLLQVDTQLGPEMKSTGEVLGIAETMEEALYKGLVAAGYQMRKQGGVLITVREADQEEAAELAKTWSSLGFRLYATRGTAEALRKRQLTVETVLKIHEGPQNTKTLLESGKLQYIVSTSAKGRIPARDSVKIRRKAVELGIPCLTSLDTAAALVKCLKSEYQPDTMELVDMNGIGRGGSKRAFIKMQGCGNDYVYFDCFEQPLENPEELSVRLSAEHFGIGADGVILLESSEMADGRMRILNRDGSEGSMCGNGIRCAAKYLYESGRVRKTEMLIETKSGVKRVQLNVSQGQVGRVTVDMGPVRFRPEQIPVNWPGDRMISQPKTVDGLRLSLTCLSMGNPHCVIFVDNLAEADVQRIGQALERDEALFPDRVNVELVQVVDGQTLQMRVWERGSGETWACGTGACAAAVAATVNGYCPKGEKIAVRMKGGTVEVQYTDETVWMTGDAAIVFDGEVRI